MSCYSLLRRIPLPITRATVGRAFGQTRGGQGVLRFFRRLTSGCLCSPGSPVHGRRFCVPMLRTLVTSPTLSRATGVHPRTQLRLTRGGQLNAGTLGFACALSSNTGNALCRFPTRCALLFVGGPNYRTYTRVVRKLGTSPIVGKFATTGGLGILSVCPSRRLSR